MKKILLTATMCLLFAICNAAEIPEFHFNPVIPRSIKIGNRSETVLFSNGKAACEIIVPERAAPILRLAGDQLAFYLEKITGAKVPVKSKSSGNAAAFILGAKGAELAGFNLSKLDRDGYIIKTIGNKIIIAGVDDPVINPAKGQIPNYNERGTLNGVYEFLERFGGVRFYFPGEYGTVVPRKKDWKIPQIDIIDRPDNTYRQIYYGKENLGKVMRCYQGLTENDIRIHSMLQTRASTLKLPFGHGLANLGLVQRFGKTHPEYFALRSNGKRHNGTHIVNRHDAAGQLCFSSNGLKQEIFQDVKAFLSGKPASSRGALMRNGRSGWQHSVFNRPFFNLGPNDAMYQCRCAQCKPVFAKGPQASSNLVWKFIADIANGLKKENIPGFVTMSAYSCYKEIPELDLPDNILIKYCTTGPWDEDNPQQQAEKLKQLNDWKKKLGHKLVLHTYMCKTAGLLPILSIPGFTPDATGSFFKKAAPDISGALLEAGTDCWMFNFMNYYVFGKVMWDPSTDVDALMEEHFRLMYGPAANEMKNFYKTLEKHWMKDIIGKIEDTSLGPRPVCPSYFDLWQKIYSPAELKRINTLFDRAEKKTADAPEYLKRIKFMRRELLGPILEGAEEFKKKVQDRKLWTLYASPIQTKLKIDGKLDEAEWKKATPVWLYPNRGLSKVEVHTRVKMLFDKDNYYVGIECDEPFTDKILCSKRKNDDVEVWRDNLAELLFASDTGDKFYYQIMFNSAGTFCDLRSENQQLNKSWNSKLEYKCTVTPHKMWTAELRIPRKSMPELKGNSFVANFSRGRILQPECKVRVPYYRWYPGVGSKSAATCGTVLLAPVRQKQNLLFCGDFDGPIKRNRMYSGKKAVWISSKPITVDRENFMTKGQSIRLQLPGGNRLIRQRIDKNLFKAGQRYQLSFYLKLENVINSKNPQSGLFSDIRFGKNGADNVLSPLKPSLTGTLPWTRYQFEFTAPANIGTKSAPYIGFYLAPDARGKAWIDHVEIIPLITAK